MQLEWPTARLQHPMLIHAETWGEWEKPWGGSTSDFSAGSFLFAIQGLGHTALTLSCEWQATNDWQFSCHLHTVDCGRLTPVWNTQEAMTGNAVDRRQQRHVFNHLKNTPTLYLRMRSQYYSPTIRQPLPKGTEVKVKWISSTPPDSIDKKGHFTSQNTGAAFLLLRRSVQICLYQICFL